MSTAFRPSAFRLVFWLLGWSLAATAAPTADWWQPAPLADGGEIAVNRSPADDRRYRYLKLDNGLQVLLVSDAASDKSAAALSVGVGSFDNPADRPGLAHFLEHMLFLGTEKYPAAAEYQAFISSHGGSHNAYTSVEQTNFFFDIEPAYLDGALDRFAQFFIAPKFDPDYVERERQAVEAEYRLKLRDDGRRQSDVISEVINPDHPLAKFSVGNRDTLADLDGRPVRDDLVAFYQRHYSADLMTLAVVGRQSLDELQAMIATRFGAIPRRPADLATGEVPLLPASGPLLIEMRPDQDQRELGLLFPLPSQRGYWQEKPAQFLGHLLGDESEHSLLAELKRQGLAESLSAGPAYDSRRGAAFAISIALTPAGVAARDQVLDQTWAWIAKVRASGIEAWRYTEFGVMQRAEFRFLEKSGASAETVALAATLHDYPPAEVLRGPFLYEHFDADLVRATAALLRPDNALITITAPEFDRLDRTSRYYQTPYAVSPVAPQRTAAWNAEPETSVLRLPGPNPYIPEHFPVSERGGISPPPKLLVETPALRLWQYRDAEFGTPRAVFNAQILTPRAVSHRGAALTELYLALVSDELSAEVYPASLAGLDFGLKRWEGGVELSVSGYADKQEILLQRLLGVLAEPKFDTARFTRVKETLIRDWRNSRKEWPVRQAVDEIAPLLRAAPRALELAKELEPVGPDSLRTFIAGLYRTGGVKAYAGGMVDADTAQRMASRVLARLAIAPERPPRLDREVRRLRPQSRLPRWGVVVKQPDRAAVLYLQGAADTLAERARFALLEKITEEPFYTEIRTEKQLGYVVGSQIMPSNRVPGMLFYAQSPRADAPRLMAEMERFLAARCQVLDTMDDAELERFKQATLAGIEERPKNMLEQAARHNESLALDYRNFDFRPRLAEAVRAETLVDLKGECGRVFGPQQRRGLWIATGDRAAADAAQDLNRASDGRYGYPW
ncbi:MAG: insulinase family protein [Gammaproteobacteria bacterium]|nr:insulinase family protein [Gammaproteobacteria bacterium]